VRQSLILGILAVLLLAMMPGCGTSSGERGPPSLLVSSARSASEESEPGESAATAATDVLAPRPANSETSSSTPTKPPEEDEGPPDGLTLDAAIERLLASNTDLAAKFQDLPKARVDVLSAGLRNNPLVFMSATEIPYQRFSEQRPGATQYNLTLVQPIDVSGKRRSSVAVAQQANQVLEARYQDAVRDEIDKLYTAYVDVLEARALVAVDRAILGHGSKAGNISVG
jgi:outer membrane protein, heavy metal efflux system